MEKKAMRSLIAVTACLVVFGGGLQADEINPGAIPNDAKWVIHINFDHFADSALADRMREKHPEKVKAFRQWLEQRYGIDPRDDLHSLTLFSNTYAPHTIAAVLTADYDRDKVKQALVDAGAATAQEGDHTLYTLSKHKHDGESHAHNGGSHEHEDDDSHKHNAKSHEHKREGDSHEHDDGHSHEHEEAAAADDKKHTAKTGKQHAVTAVLFSDAIIIFATDPEQAKSAIALLEGDSESLEDADSKLIAEFPTGAIFYGAAIDLGELAGRLRPFPVLEKHEHVRVAWGLRGNEMFKQVTLVAKDDEVAREMEKVLEGFVALGKICAADSETAAELYDDVEIDRNGATVTASWEGDVDDVMKALDELQPRMEAWRKHHRERHEQR
jgi:hypothetical protein